MSDNEEYVEHVENQSERDDGYDIQEVLNNARNQRDAQLQTMQNAQIIQNNTQAAQSAQSAQPAQPAQNSMQNFAQPVHNPRPRVFTPRPKFFYNPIPSNIAPDTISVQTAPVSVMQQQYPPNIQFVAVPKGSKLLQPDGDSDDSEFELLSYEDIQINLRLLGDIVQEEKLHISSDGKHMVVDNRYGQTVRRYYSGDSRQKTLKFIKHVYSETERHCTEIVDLVSDDQQSKENTEKLVNLYGLIESSVRGLDRLNMTYSDDKLCAAKIATIKKNFQTYCDRTLKGTIEGFKQQQNVT